MWAGFLRLGVALNVSPDRAKLNLGSPWRPQREIHTQGTKKLRTQIGDVSAWRRSRVRRAGGCPGLRFERGAADRAPPSSSRRGRGAPVARGQGRGRVSGRLRRATRSPAGPGMRKRGGACAERRDGGGSDARARRGVGRGGFTRGESGPPANARWGKRAEGATPAKFASKVGKWVGQVIGPSLAPLPPRSRRAPPMEPRSGWTDPRAAGDASERMNLEEER